MIPTRPALLLACLLCHTPVAAQSAPDDPVEDPVTLDRVQVRATRLIGVGDFDTPASVSTVILRDDDNGNAVNVSDALGGVPGLLARDRQNYAQDTQLSIRGFGARSTFGVRGVRLYADGIPASMPDGQGQLSHFNLLRPTASRSCAARFPRCTATPPAAWCSCGARTARRKTHGALQCDGRQRRARTALACSCAAQQGAAAATTWRRRAFETDGYREHSAARRDSANAQAGLRLAATRKLTLVLNHVDLPDAQDPLGPDPCAGRRRSAPGHGGGHAVRHPQIGAADARPG